jgi:hypothetical protein
MSLETPALSPTHNALFNLQRLIALGLICVNISAWLCDARNLFESKARKWVLLNRKFQKQNRSTRRKSGTPTGETTIG